MFLGLTRGKNSGYNEKTDMAEKFIIEGQKPLEGEVTISGSKNNAGPVLAATFLTEEPCVIDNLPLVEDALNMLKLLEGLGARVKWQGERRVRIDTKNIDPNQISDELVGKMRIAVLLIGPLLARFKQLKISHPGGDELGAVSRRIGKRRARTRPITTHLNALKELGVEIEENDNHYYFSARGARAQEVTLDEFSVTATENLLMFASGLEGKTIIKGAASEPHVQDLSRMLKEMGVKVKGIGTHQLEIFGLTKPKGVTHRIVPDYLEAGTFVVIGAITPGQLMVRDIIPWHLDLFWARLKKAGVDFQKGKDFVRVNFSPLLQATRIQSFPYPGFPTDLLPVMVPLLAQAEGRSLIHDPLYENRLGFTNELRKMGADIEVVDPHRAFVFGKSPLFGTEIRSWDIRAGAALVIAALVAEGKSILGDIYQIERGYERIDQKLQKLGADIKRVDV